MGVLTSVNGTPRADHLARPQSAVFRASQRQARPSVIVLGRRDSVLTYPQGPVRGSGARETGIFESLPSSQPLRGCCPTTALSAGARRQFRYGFRIDQQYRGLHLYVDSTALKTMQALKVKPNSVDDALAAGKSVQADRSDRRAAVVQRRQRVRHHCQPRAIAPCKAQAISRRAVMPGIPEKRTAMKPALATRSCARLSDLVGYLKRCSGYHRRRLVETKVRFINLMGELGMARDFDCQVAEVQIRAETMNRFIQLVTPETVRIG